MRRVETTWAVEGRRQNRRLQVSVMSDPWKVSDDIFPRSGEAEEKLRFLLNYAVLAPSGHNTQPWLFRVRNGEVDLYADRTRGLPVVDPEDRALVISCGAALFNLRVAVRHFGYAGEVQNSPDPDEPDLLARVRLGPEQEATEEEELLFEVLKERHSNREPFEVRQVPGRILSALQAAAWEEGAWFHLVQDKAAKHTLAELIAEGDRIQLADKRFRRELASWVHPNRTKSRDGIPGYAFGFGDVMSLAGPFVIRTFDTGKGQAAKDRQLAEGSPVLAVLGTEGDAPSDWLAAGQVLARILLRARAEGIWASFLNQPIEVSELRPRVRETVGEAGFPQLLLRMGYGQEVRPTPRRAIEEVLR
jgi:nitroreductase